MLGGACFPRCATSRIAPANNFATYVSERNYSMATFYTSILDKQLTDVDSTLFSFAIGPSLWCTAACSFTSGFPNVRLEQLSASENNKTKAREAGWRHSSSHFRLLLPNIQLEAAWPSRLSAALLPSLIRYKLEAAGNTVQTPKSDPDSPQYFPTINLFNVVASTLLHPHPLDYF